MNRACIIGRLTRDVDLRFTPAGKAHVKFTVAVDRPTKREDGSHYTDFISCVAWDARAELIYKWTHKGDMVGIEGFIMTGSYQGKNGKVYTTDICVDNVLFLTKRGEDTPADEFVPAEGDGSELPWDND